MNEILTLEMILGIIITIGVTILSGGFLYFQQKREKQKYEVHQKNNSVMISKMPKITLIVGLIFSFLFIFLIWLLGPLLKQRFVLGPDQGAAWYYWQLPVSNLTSQIIVWIFYLAHQLSIWVLIYWAQKNVQKLRDQSKSGLTTFNWIALSLNVVFIFLHLIQTLIWYDGLAQDVPIWTSQGSVIVMLAFLLIMQNRQRGLILGKKAGKPITRDVARLFRNIHMYVFSWALIYTFWFHPMDSDLQLLTGFFYMFLLFIQVSLSYTKLHYNKKWVILLEGFVGIHALVVAINNTVQLGSSDMWPMFLSGFLFMVIFTYLYSLKMKSSVRWVIFVLFAGFILWLYIPFPFGYGRDLTIAFRLEFLWIPIVLYGLAYLFSTIAYFYLKFNKRGNITKEGVSPSS